jgi:predicted Fe-S protein YdhL (DUF1289 family)
MNLAAQIEDEVVASPCTKVCKIDQEKKWCMGCLRTVEEITVWSKASAFQKRNILIAVKQREIESTC